MTATESLTRRLIELLECGDSEVTQYTCTHKASGVALWIANGVTFVDTYPGTSGFNLWQRYRLWRAVRRATARAMLMRLDANKEGKA